MCVKSFNPKKAVIRFIDGGKAEAETSKGTWKLSVGTSGLPLNGATGVTIYMELSISFAAQGPVLRLCVQIGHVAISFMPLKAVQVMLDKVLIRAKLP